MLDSLYQLIKKNEKEGDFTYTRVTDDMLKKAEEALGVKIPQQFRWFLKTFGDGGIGMEVMGIALDGTMEFVDSTLEYRKYGLPNSLIIIESCDEWFNCIDTNNGEIVSWAIGETREEVTVLYKDFETYLTEIIQDILENMDL